jgi:hypothetical protein
MSRLSVRHANITHSQKRRFRRIRFSVEGNINEGTKLFLGLLRLSRDDLPEMPWSRDDPKEGSDVSREMRVLDLLAEKDKVNPSF